MQLLPSSMTGLAIGTYATIPTVLGPSLCKVQGVVASAHTDFTMSMLLSTTTLMPLTAGTAAVLLGTRVADMSMRRLSIFSSVAFPTGLFLLPAAAVHANEYYAFMLSYGLIGGLGFFTSYHQINPHLAARWFPSRHQGLALSIYFTAFGGGALIGVPVLRALLAHFRHAPTRLGSLSEITTTVGDHGQRIVTIDGVDHECIAATARDLAESGFGSGSMVEEGIFLLDGSGSSGACETMVCTGAAVFTLMHAAAWAYRQPHPQGSPPLAATTTQHAKPEATGDGGRVGADLSFAEAVRTPHFYLLAAGSLGISVTGLPFLHAGTFMINDLFGSSALGTSAAAASAAAFPAALKGGNVLGRLIWGPVCDAVGAPRALLLLGIGVPAIGACVAAPHLIDSDAATALAVFQAGAITNCAIYAGVPLLLVPAAATRFGKGCAAQVYWRTWIALPVANVLATGYLARARDANYKEHATRLAELCEPEAFLQTFGAGKEQITHLVASKTVTIPLLLKICPTGTADPSPWLYNEVLSGFGLVGALAIGCNYAAFRLPLRSGR